MTTTKTSETREKPKPKKLIRRKPKDEIDRRFATEDEMLFLRGIGGWREKGATCALPHKAKLLMNYLRVALLRSDWGEIDRDAVISYATGLLRAIRATLLKRAAARLGVSA